MISYISPNLELKEDVEAEMYWIQFSDFYDWPHIQLFDDFHHLKRLLLTADFNSIHNLMLDENKIRKNQATRSWCRGRWEWNEEMRPRQNG